MRRQRALTARLAEQQHLDEQRRRFQAEFGAAPSDQGEPTRRGRRRGRPRRRKRRSGNRFVAVLAVVALVGAGLTAERWSTTGGDGLGWIGGSSVLGRETTQTDRPSPRSDAADAPLGTSPTSPSAGGNYAFVAMRPGTDAPVAYDPCRSIRYVVNDAHAPPGADAMLAQALAATSAASGLVFEFVGMTDEQPTVDREAYQPDRYGDSWAPVVIGWTSPDEDPALEGAVAGQGGSAWLEVENVTANGERVARTATFVTGMISLDGPQIATIARESPQGVAAARAVVMHELGHLVGLQHVEDPTELMNPENSAGVTEFAAGDLRGLSELGQGPCIPEL